MSDQPADEDFTSYRPEDLEEWQRWKGEGDPPLKWWALDPKSGAKVMVYRSYADYCWD